MLEAYGLSENTVPVAANRINCYRFGSVGKLVPNNEIKFAEDHEILVRGPGVFRGYYREPSDSSLYTVDGFYRTGDCGYNDRDGFLWLTGRKRDIIKSATGRRIAPGKLEAIYSDSKFVEQIVVVGDNRKYLAALVVPNRSAIEAYLRELGTDTSFDQPNAIAAIKELLFNEFQSLGASIAHYERVVSIGILSEPFSVERGELTGTLKIRRKAIEAHFAEFIDRLYQVGMPQVAVAWEPPSTHTIGSPSWSR